MIPVSRSILLSILLCFLCTVVCVADVTDLTAGTIQLPDGWTQKRTGTLDSERGQLARGDGGLIVHYDIGFLAGMQMSRDKEPECIWYREQIVHGYLAHIGLVKTESGRELVVTLVGRGTSRLEAVRQSIARAPFKYPANFRATVKTDEDVVDVLLIAMSYEAKP